MRNIIIADAGLRDICKARITRNHIFDFLQTDPKSDHHYLGDHLY